jgi:hypothetical protein
VKEKATYRRFDLLAFLAILGCGAMLLFESIFIFELYDRAPDEIVNLIPPPVRTPVIAPAVNPPKAVTPDPVSVPPVTAPAGDAPKPAVTPVG